MSVFPLEFTVIVSTAPEGWTPPEGSVSLGSGRWQVPVFGIEMGSQTQTALSREDQIVTRLEESVVIAAPRGTIVVGQRVEVDGDTFSVVDVAEDMGRNPWFDPGLVRMRMSRTGPAA